MRGNLDDNELVDFRELVGFRRGGAGHSGELLVKTKIILKGDRGQGDVLRLDRYALLRLKRLMQPLGVTPPGHHSSRKFVDDHDFVVTNDVVLVALEKLMSTGRLIEVVDKGRV